MTNQRTNDVDTITTFNGTDRLLINTDVANNVLEQIEKDDFVADIISTDVNNAIEVGTDNKLTTSSDVTLQGNTFNGNSQLIQTNSSGQYPALDGSLITGVSATVDLSPAIELRNIIKSCKLDSNGECDLLEYPQSQQEIIQNFTQPILTSNGTVGVDSFASFASSVMAGRESWKAFDNNANVGFSYAWEPAAGVPQYLGWYNSNPIKCSSITIRNSGTDSASYVVRAGELQYSDDGTSWNIEQVFTNDVTTSYAYWTFNIDTPVFSKYKRLYITQTSSSNTPTIQHLQMNGALELVQSAAGSSVIVQSTSVNPLIYVNPNGTISTITSKNSLDFASGYANGKYPLIQLSDRTVDVASSYTESKTEPTNPTNNDYWLNTSVIPNTLQKYEVSEWVEKQGIFIGNVNVASNLVSSVEQPVIRNLQSVGHTVIETYTNGTSGYRIWSDGYCEQWGYVTSGASPVSLLKIFADANYIVTASIIGSSVPSWSVGVNKLNGASFVINMNTGFAGVMWSACGYLDEGEY